MKAFFEPLRLCREIQEAGEDLARGKTPVLLDGCIDIVKAQLIGVLSEKVPCRVVVAANELRARELYEDLRVFDRQTWYYPPKDVIFFNADVHGSLIVRQRLGVIRQLLEGQAMTIVTTIDGLMDRVLPLDYIREQVTEIDVGSFIETEALAKKMVQMGYERVFQVESPGQFAIRGGIIDFYNMSDDCPYRLELWDNEVDSIRSFDVESQRSIQSVQQVVIYPASEYVFGRRVIDDGMDAIEASAKKLKEAFLKDGALEAAGRLDAMQREIRENLETSFGQTNIDSLVTLFYKDTVSLMDYFSKAESRFFLDEPVRLHERAQAVMQEFREGMAGRLEKGLILPEQMDVMISPETTFAALGGRSLVMLAAIAMRQQPIEPRRIYTMTVRSVSAYNNSFDLLVSDLKRFRREKYRIVLASRSRTRAKRIAEDLCDQGVTAFFTEDPDRQAQPGEVMTLQADLRGGAEYPLIKVLYIAESDIFGREKKKRTHRRQRVLPGEAVTGFSDLSIGDYVVHENHGLGVYRGIEKVTVDRKTRDYIKIEYADGGNLYIPATQLEMIQKYAGAEAAKPKLNKLGSGEWNKTRSRVRKAVTLLAEDLIRLYAVRASRPGHAYEPDTVWQHEFEEMFPYEETQDQLDAIAATKADMESTRIMDRLICGDVGYGKTEIAIRAAFKAVQEGKQVVMLVPTTILAQQHYNTFSQRMKDYPITVDMLCRFRTQAQQNRTLKELSRGMVDILIGTHRVLSKDVVFKDLGLLIVDEEQRFGVSHKERIKKLCEDVDVLTLSATPIPRTLHMGLIGIRDMSILEEPPQDRVPIQTYVMEYNEEMVREAIHRELARGGQVYYVYNRVQTIPEFTASVARLVPEAEVAYAHGQMKERELEDIMYRFINREIDVLVSTTIIETGLDIANVNTMIIHDADKMGLSQLYQLRGRVGRSSRTAYAFLMYRRNTILREVAEKRLAAIREFTDLGAGFRIAMRDLEIRGAGSLLGEQQSGHMEAVGYDLYCKMLTEAIGSLTGKTPESAFETTVEMDVNAYLPADYIRNEMQKLEMYKRISLIDDEEHYDEVTAELIDRFGDLPEAAKNLLDVALIKALAHNAGIVQLTQKGNESRFYMYPQAKVDVSRIPALLKKYKNAMTFTGGRQPCFKVRTKTGSGVDIFKCEKIVIHDIQSLMDSQESVIL